MPIIQSDFRAAWWLPGVHAQTIWPSLLRRRRHPPIHWERVELEDGDFIDLDHAARRMEQGLSRIYQRHLITRLQQSYRRKFARIPSPLRVELAELDNFHRFDSSPRSASFGIRL